MSRRFEIKIDSNLENLSVIADFVAKTMRQLGIEEHIYEVQTAVDEACTNVIEYAYADREGVITISCELQGEDFVISIMDNGKPFDPTSVPPPDLEGNWDTRRIGGLGIYLMKKLMDEVSYHFDVEKGNMLVMRKTLNKTNQDTP